ncbi:heme-binding domain-containing protein [Anaerolineales bacterium HSG25]|nr:heme-binding domain-containing protein [Anaerolineales bacterium HSG25]
MLKKIIIGIVVAIILGVILIQFIPVRRTNPSVTREIQWNSAETADLARRACYDCHSNETVWPWYSKIAPVSIFVATHVDNGRQSLNFSEWDKDNKDADEAMEEIREDKMPLASYLPLHPEADLTPAEKEALIKGLEETYRNESTNCDQRRIRGVRQ